MCVRVWLQETQWVGLILFCLCDHSHASWRRIVHCTQSAWPISCTYHEATSLKCICVYFMNFGSDGWRHVHSMHMLFASMPFFFVFCFLERTNWRRKSDCNEYHLWVFAFPQNPIFIYICTFTRIICIVARIFTCIVGAIIISIESCRWCSCVCIAAAW